MFEWWGPILYEYYGGTEFNGLTHVTPQDWLKHPGTVGKSVFGTLHVCDESGEEAPERRERPRLLRAAANAVRVLP